MDPIMFEQTKPRRRKPADSATGDLFAPAVSLIDQFVPPAPDSEVFRRLVSIALELVESQGDVIVGEVVFEYERRTGKLVGGIPMSDPVKEQRQSSWLPRVMRAARLVTIDATRRSPVDRHHKHRHSIWVRPTDR